MGGVNVPLLAVNAADDPIIRRLPIEAVSASRSVVLAVTPQGGHLGWFEGGWRWGRKRPPPRWIRKPVVEWVKASVEMLGPRKRKASDEWEMDEQTGFIVEKTRRTVGFKILSIGGTVIGTGDENEGQLQGL